MTSSIGQPAPGQAQRVLVDVLDHDVVPADGHAVGRTPGTGADDRAGRVVDDDGHVVGIGRVEVDDEAVRDLRRRWRRGRDGRRASAVTESGRRRPERVSATVPGRCWRRPRRRRTGRRRGRRRRRTRQRPGIGWCDPWRFLVLCGMCDRARQKSRAASVVADTRRHRGSRPSACVVPRPRRTSTVSRGRPSRQRATSRHDI